MAKKSKSTHETRAPVPDAALADLEIMAHKDAMLSDAIRMTAAGELKSCANCRTPDWRAADATWCLKLRIALDPAAPLTDCDYWRRPLV